jgi:hypothetical protein
VDSPAPPSLEDNPEYLKLKAEAAALELRKLQQL